MVTVKENELLGTNKVLQYPLGLGSTDKDAYGNASQYMLFRINTDEKASTLKDDSLGSQTLVTNARAGTGIQTSQFTKGNVKDVDALTVTRFGQKAVEKETWRVQKGMRKLNKVIVLPMPNTHIVGTSVQYSDDYTPTDLTKMGDLYNQLGNGVISEGFTHAKNAGIAGILNKAKSNLTNTNALLAEERLALNPMKEVMFKSFGFRQFSFQYNFAPKSQREADMVQDIIETFRYYSLPEISPAKRFYLLPAEFEIAFMLGVKDNPNIPRITTSVLQRVSTNYSPNHGVWATLPNGSPVAIDMTLEFLEVELVDRNRIWNKDSIITSGF